MELSGTFTIDSSKCNGDDDDKNSQQKSTNTGDDVVQDDGSFFNIRHVGQRAQRVNATTQRDLESSDG